MENTRDRTSAEREYEAIDLHIHTTVSDGTDTPEAILRLVREKGFSIFSVTDHDDIKASRIIPALLGADDPWFIPGAEFSCKDEEGKYHILGYGYDLESAAIRELVEYSHSLRIKKVRTRLEFLEKEFGFTFPEKEWEDLFALDNPGKPHIGNLMVKYGFAKNKDSAISDFINKLHVRNEYLRPEEAIRGVLAAGGIPVLAHPVYGSGDELILGEEMDARLRKLIGFGLRGVEAFYSGFTSRLRTEMLAFAEKYDLYITAGSDYHGKNKLVVLGDTGLDSAAERPARLFRFLQDVKICRGGNRN